MIIMKLNAILSIYVRCVFVHFIEIKIHPGTSESESDQLNIIGGKIGYV